MTLDLKVRNPASAARGRHKVGGASSIHKGVCWDKRRAAWKAYIRIDGRLKALGYYATEDDAALVYNKAATQAFGDDARLNEVDG